MSAWNGNYFHKINEFFGGQTITETVCDFWTKQKYATQNEKFLVVALSFRKSIDDLYVHENAQIIHFVVRRNDAVCEYCKNFWIK